MSSKKSLRDDFRNGVLDRDGYKCVVCGYKPEDRSELDAHHITDRHFIPNGGYCPANGITLCTDRCTKPVWIGSGLDCHQKAEAYHVTGTPILGYSPADLYAKIHTSYRMAYSHSLRLTLPDPQVFSLMEKIKKVGDYEIVVCAELSELISGTTWELSCGELGESDPFVLGYGVGRYVDR